MTVSEAAKQLGMNPQTLRLALQQGLFPFGCAVHTSKNRYTYYICENGLRRYLKGEIYVSNSNSTSYIAWNTGNSKQYNQ